jgi:hypothetical protein
MSNTSFFKIIRSCEAIYGADETVKYVVFSTSNDLFLGVVIYMSRQFNIESIENVKQEKHFPSVSEKQAVDSCEEWIRENINNNVSISCTK